jgi:hypothetical protein
MKETGLDGCHRKKDGQIQQKRSDTLNKNHPDPVPGYGQNVPLKKSGSTR